MHDPGGSVRLQCTVHLLHLWQVPADELQFEARCDAGGGGKRRDSREGLP